MLSLVICYSSFMENRCFSRTIYATGRFYYSFSMNRVCDDLCDVLVLFTFVNGVLYGFIVAKGGCELLTFTFMALILSLIYLVSLFLNIVVYVTKLCLLYTLEDQSISVVVLP